MISSSQFSLVYTQFLYSFWSIMSGQPRVAKYKQTFHARKFEKILLESA